MDNDFGNTFHGFAKVFLTAVDWNETVEGNFTKEKLAKIINDMMLPMYLLFQSNGQWEHTPSINMQVYPEHIYLNEEIDEKLKNFESWANYSFLYIDTDNQQSEIW